MLLNIISKNYYYYIYNIQLNGSARSTLIMIYHFELQVEGARFFIFFSYIAFARLSTVTTKTNT